MRTNLRRLKRPSSAVPPVAKTSQKSWAERHAPLATIIAAYSTLAAVVIAGFGYYFTVIPLYQKAAVDEQLAKRELELKSLDERLAVARKQTYELARARLLDRFALQASWDCGVGQERMFLRMTDSDASPAVDKRTIEERLSPSIAECLSEFTQVAANSKKLTDADLEKLKEATNKLGAALDQKRLEVLAKIKAVPERARLDERVLDASTIDRGAQEISELAGPYWTPEQRARVKERWFLTHVRSVQLGIASKHWTESSKAIGDLYRAGVWPRVNVTE